MLALRVLKKREIIKKEKVENVCAGFCLPARLQIFKFLYLPDQQFMLLTCPLEKEGIIVKPIFSHFHSGRLLSSTAKVNSTSVPFCKACSFSQKIKVKVQVESSPFAVPTWTQLQFLSMAMSQLPCKPQPQHSLAAEPPALPVQPSGSAIKKLKNRSLCTHTSTRYQRLNIFCPRQFSNSLICPKFQIQCSGQHAK